MNALSLVLVKAEAKVSLPERFRMGDSAKLQPSRLTPDLTGAKWY